MSDRSAWKKETSPGCSGCKIQRKKCSDKCVLAPFFPQNDPQKFLLVHRVFGNGHVIKLLQDLPAEKRGDAVCSLVYEANERVRDPVHGCAGIIKDLQKKVAEIQLELESTKAQLANIRFHHGNLFTGYEEVSSYLHFDTAAVQQIEDTLMNPTYLADVDPLQLWNHNCIY